MSLALAEEGWWVRRTWWPLVLGDLPHCYHGYNIKIMNISYAMNLLCEALQDHEQDEVKIAVYNTITNFYTSGEQ